MNEYIAIIENAVKNSVDEVEHSFERLSYFTHLNETVAFCELFEYSSLCKDSCVSYSGKASGEAVFRVSVLGKRGMSAKELCQLADSQLVPALKNTSLDLISVTRKPCEYSREQARYRITVDIVAQVITDELYEAKHTVIIGEAEYRYFSDISISNGTKMYNEATCNGNFLSGVLANEPKKITLKAYILPENSMLFYQNLNQRKGMLYPVSVDGVSFNQMLMSKVSCDLGERRTILTVELTEVAY